MVDSIAILPALSFLEQIDDLSNFLTRALPEAEKNQFLDSIRQLIESSAKTVTEQTEEGEETKQVMSEPSDEDKEKTVGKIVAVITEGHPGLEGTDRGESSAYLESMNWSRKTDQDLSILLRDRIAIPVVDYADLVGQERRADAQGTHRCRGQECKRF